MFSEFVFQVLRLQPIQTNTLSTQNIDVNIQVYINVIVGCPTVGLRMKYRFTYSTPTPIKFFLQVGQKASGLARQQDINTVPTQWNFLISFACSAVHQRHLLANLYSIQKKPYIVLP